MDDNECCFVVDKTSNPNRGPTDSQSDMSPLEKKMNAALVDRVGKATSPQSGMGDTMSDKPLIGRD